MDTNHAKAASSGVESKGSNTPEIHQYISNISIRRKIPISVRERYVVIVGSSGSGKSGIINALETYCQVERQRSCLHHESVTQEAIEALPPLNFKAENGKPSYVVKLYDTRGLTDSNASFTQMVPQWNRMVKRELHIIHFVVFVLPVDRLSKGLMEEIKLLLTNFESWGMQAANVLLVLNKCDFFRQELIDQYVEDFQKDAEVPLILRQAKVLRACFLNPKDVDPFVAEAADLRMSTSTNSLVDLLLTEDDIQPFFAHEAIVSEELKALEQLKRELERSNQEEISRLQQEMAQDRKKRDEMAEKLSRLAVESDKKKEMQRQEEEKKSREEEKRSSQSIAKSCTIM